MADSEYQSWFSTYGILTANRILERFNIQLSHDELVLALKQPDHPYFPLLYVPLKNIFNGIIFQQAYDYQVYIQKLFIDYRLSAEYAKDAELPGQSTRDDLNEIFNELLVLCKKLSDHKTTHYRVISESQAWLILLMKKKKLKKEGIEVLIKEASFIKKLNEFKQRAEDDAIMFRHYRSEFQNMIVRTTELLNALPDYALDVEKEVENREFLTFDPNIGNYGEIS
ncbi:MAG: hypothetical protein ACOYKA_05185 [Legionellaceae bacterium]